MEAVKQGQLVKDGEIKILKARVKFEIEKEKQRKKEEKEKRKEGGGKQWKFSRQNFGKSY